MRDDDGPMCSALLELLRSLSTAGALNIPVLIRACT